MAQEAVQAIAKDLGGNNSGGTLRSFTVLLETGRLTALIGMLTALLTTFGLLIYMFIANNPMLAAAIVDILGKIVLLIIPFASATSIGHTYLHNRLRSHQVDVVANSPNAPAVAQAVQAVQAVANIASAGATA